MHIEPGIVDTPKMVLAYGTAAAVAGYSIKLISNDLKTHSIPSFIARAGLAIIAVFMFFEVLPRFPVGISEVHFILGTTLLLLLGTGPAAVGLAGGLLLQGAFFAPSDIPMYFVNVTTLLFPLFLIDAIAKRVIPRHKPYVDLSYHEAFKMSLAYQGGIIAWVAFWALYGQGIGTANLSAVGIFGVAYLIVIIIEPIADLAILAAAKTLRSLEQRGLFTQRRLYNSA